MELEALVGCWYFEQTDGEGRVHLPWGVQLTEDSIVGFPAVQALDGVRRAATLTSSGEQDFPIGYWRPLAGDSLELGYPAGGGLVVHAAVPAGGVDVPVLAGTVRAVGDVVEPSDPGRTPEEPRPVRLTWARCP